MKAMDAASPNIHLTTYGYTYEGRAAAARRRSARADARPETVRATKKTRIYIQGNIHAGEVEGKEALLWLLRSIAKGERAAWLNSVVLLINPIYNADGNERVNLRNRGRQNGPVGGMGQRHNAQDLDLNRDCTKLETSEARSLARLMTDYDPHIAIDLHTTDGSAHGYYLTYQTSVSPNTSPGLIALARKELFPAVTKTVKAKHGWDYFYYGNISRQGGEQAWYNDLDLYKPRYTQTYFGIRNRLGILVETYSYATFEDRIKANYWFLEEVIDYAVKNGAAVRKAVDDGRRRVDRRQGAGRSRQAGEGARAGAGRDGRHGGGAEPLRPRRGRCCAAPTAPSGSSRCRTSRRWRRPRPAVAPRYYVLPAVAAQPPRPRRPRRPPRRGRRQRRGRRAPQGASAARAARLPAWAAAVRARRHEPRAARVRQRRRSPDGARREVHQDRQGDGVQGRAIRHRADHAGPERVPRGRAAQAAHDHRQVGGRPSRRCPPVR